MTVGTIRGLAGWLADFCDAVVPCGCAACGVAVSADRSPICDLCASRVAPIPLPLCPRCGITRVVDQAGAAGCSQCESWPPHLCRTASACLHDGAAARIVRGLKYRGWTQLARFMAIRMLPALHRVVDSPHPILVPVPLAPARRRERGFNQAELLADALSELTGWEVADLLCRVRGGPSQARLGRRQRERRAAGAYAIDPGVAEGLVSYTQMGTDGTGCETEMSALVAVVVDDVITTGSTAGACAAALEAAGLECLGAVSFARTAPALEAG